MPLLSTLLSCGDSSPTTGTTYGGTYSVPAEFGGGSGSVSFTLENNSTVFCFQFSGAQARYSTPCKNPATDSFPVVDGKFSVPVLTTGEGAYTLEGQFTSLVHASGNILGPPGSQAVLTWSVTAEGDDD